jgi:DNA-binding CsgD family transcriptional regulator
MLLRGRGLECEALDQQLQSVRSGQSSVRVLRGEAGVGKTALLEHVAEQASGCRIVRASGVQSEMELAFAGLHQLCASMLDGVGGLPGPQRDALRVAFGLQEGGAPDRFLMALAVLNLLADAAEVRPLVCLIDDAQWLDRTSLQVLSFVARRLLAERIAMVFAVREPSDAGELAGLPDMDITGISEDDARLVLASSIPGVLDERVRDRIVAETRGNPLALLELPRGLTPAELAGGFGLPDPGSVPGRIEQSFARRLASLPHDAQRLALAAAAEPLGDVTLLWRAATALGIATDAIAPAEAAGLLELGTRVRFRHPLARSAVYKAASLTDRRAVHAALAEATDPGADPDRRAWHRAHAATGLDETVADELERSAARAQRRGGLAAAAAFLERAAELTPDPAHRGLRALAAAQAKLEAGSPAAAEALLAVAELAPLDELQTARLQTVRAQIAFARRRGSDAAPLLLDAAKRLTRLDAQLARETCLEALAAGIFAGRVGDAGDILAVARDAPATLPPTADDLLLDGLATMVTQGYAAAVPQLRAALEAFRQHDGAHPEEDRWLWLACRASADLWDLDTWDTLAARGVRHARETGRLSVLPMAASYCAGVHVHAGEFDAASTLMEEASAITQATGTAMLIQTRPMVAAWRGDEDAVRALVEPNRQASADRGQGMALSMIDCASALLFNGLGRYEEALAVAERACDHDGLSLFALSLIELVEAAARSDRPEVASAAVDRLAERTSASGTDWALGLEARSRALVASGPSAGLLFDEAVARLDHRRTQPHLARAQLVYGEWLRREDRRLDAREQLRAAHETFSAIGAKAFAERARRELLATGETARKRTADTRDALTPQEAWIAQLAAEGHTNTDIGTRLFISPRTVEYHLRKVFVKFDISSRKELTRALAATEAPTAPAPSAGRSRAR